MDFCKRFFNLILIEYWLLPCLLSFFSMTAWSSEAGKLNPHGTVQDNLSSVSIEARKECKVCHYVEGSKLKTKEDLASICASCHGKVPHSGAAEHIDKGVGCLDCHSPHKAGALKTDWGPMPNFLKFPEISGASLVQKTASSAQLSQLCTDCHSFK